MGQYYIVCSSHACSHHLECCIPIIFPPFQIMHASQTERSLKHYKFFVLCHVGQLPFYFHCWPKCSVTQVSLLLCNDVTHCVSSEWLEWAGLEGKSSYRVKKNFEIERFLITSCIYGIVCQVFLVWLKKGMEALLNSPCWSILWLILLVLHNPGIWVCLIWSSHT